ncbi:protease pro-enzyme activation domain-containing protein [Streptacidiphilus monticola]
MAVLSVLGLLVVGGVVIGLNNHKKNEAGGGSVDAGSMGFGGASSSGGTSWAPPSWATAKNDLGHADPKTVVTGTVWFAQAKPQDLASYALQAATPGNPNYHKFLTPDQTGSTFAAHADAATVVSQWVQSAGMKVLNKDEQSMTVSTTVAKVEETLKIKIDRFKHNGKVYLSTTSQPQYPSNIGDYVASVTGLVTSSPIDAPHVFKTADDPNCSKYFGQRKAAYPAGPSGGQPAQFLCGYTAAQLRSAYGASGSGLTGKGVTIAIVDAFASPTIEQDVNRWSRQMGLPELQPGQFKQVLPASYDPQSTAQLAQGWWGEETLDVEAVHAIAPDAKIVYYAAKSPSTDEFFNVFEKIISERSADIVSNSWGSPEGSGDQANYQAGLQLFQRAAAEGISFNFSTGDDGDYTQTDSNAEPSPFSSYPSGDPWVTAVGGTTLGIGAGGEYQWETGWGNVLYPRAAAAGTPPAPSSTTAVAAATATSSTSPATRRASSRTRWPRWRPDRRRASSPMWPCWPTR